MNFFKDLMKDAHKRPSYVKAKACIKIAKNIETIMDEKNINNAQLAALLGCSPPYITKILKGDANLTIETLSKLCIALDCDLTLKFEPKTPAISVEQNRQLSLESLFEAQISLSELAHFNSRYLERETAAPVKTSHHINNVHAIRNHRQNAPTASSSAA